MIKKIIDVDKLKFCRFYKTFIFTAEMKYYSNKPKFKLA